jgi:hypothetical protein
MDSPCQLVDLVRHTSFQPVPPAVKALVDEILVRFGNAVEAVLFYGSCLRAGDDLGGIVDLYVLVDTYRTAYGPGIAASLNKLLPPNVFYLEIPFENRRARAKYAVLSVVDFQRSTSTARFHSYFWARFAQPTALAYVRSSAIAEKVHAALVQALLTFVTRVLPQMTSPFCAGDLWRRGLLLSYRSELRAERPEKIVRLFDAAADYYEQATRLVVRELPFVVQCLRSETPVSYRVDLPRRICWLNRWQWRFRIWQGKILSVLRLSKGLLTFRGGVDYILWKIERHSGVNIELSPRLRRLPWLGVCITFWRLFRRGAFR